MKVEELIANLQKLPAGAEVNLWNGFVEDVQDVAVEIVPVQLSKYVFEQWLWRVAKERNRSVDSFTLRELRKLKVQYGELDYGTVGAAGHPDVYAYKTVYALQAEPAGKVTFDRHGKTYY